MSRKDVHMKDLPDDEIQRCLKKAEEFLNGEKNRKENTEEYKKLMNDFRYLKQNYPDNSVIKDIYDALNDDL